MATYANFLSSLAVPSPLASLGLGRSCGSRPVPRTGSRARGCRSLLAGVVDAFLLCGGQKTAPAQQRRPLEPPVATQPETPQHRTRLYLKDGSYQSVLSYHVAGEVVRYRSAERNGAEEEIPRSLVDLPATEAWAKAHDPLQATAADGAQQPPVLSPERAREEAERTARMPEVAKDLRLPEEDSVLVLDTFQGTPELVPLPQQGSDLNRETAHAVLRKELNPAASPHDMLFLKDERADVQLHVPDPTFFVRLENKDRETAGNGGGFTVDTQGQAGRATPEGGAPESRYVLQRVDVRRGERAVSSLQLRLLDSGRPQPDLVAMKSDLLPGGFWKQLTPKQRLEFGEYVLLEVLNDRTVNANVWDFGVHPTAKENDEALRPEPKKPVKLERRRP